MPVDPYPGVPSPNTLADAAKMRSQLDALFSPVLPRVRVYQPIDSVLANNDYPAIPFSQERFDTDAMHVTSGATTRLTCKTAGTYLIGGHITFATNSAGHREISIVLNGAGNAIAAQAGVGNSALQSKLTVVTIWPLAVNDYVELKAFQNSGGNLNVVYTDRESPEFWATYVSA